MIAVLMGPGEIGIIVIMAVLLTILVLRDRKSVQQAIEHRKASQKPQSFLSMQIVIGILVIVVIVLSLILAWVLKHWQNQDSKLI